MAGRARDADVSLASEKRLSFGVWDVLLFGPTWDVGPNFSRFHGGMDGGEGGETGNGEWGNGEESIPSSRVCARARAHTHTHTHTRCVCSVSIPTMGT